MRFTNPTVNKVHYDARSFPYKARGDMSLWKCWNCGFICNEDRDNSSGLSAGDNQTVNAIPAFGGEGKSGMIISTEVGYECVMMEQDSQGDDKVIYHEFVSDITKGCPFCGSTNYKG